MRSIVPLVAVLSLPVLALAQTTHPAPAPAPALAERNAPPGPVLTARTANAKATASDVAPGRALARRITEVKLTGVALENAIDYVRDLSGANIHVNWRALEQLNVTRQTTVSIKLTDVTARRVLKGLLDDTGMGEQLTYYIDEGVIEITTREIADNQMITKVYPVQDLVTSIPNFEGPSFNLQNQTNQTSGQGGGGSSGGSLFSGSNPQAQETPASRAQQGEDLAKLIKETVRPDVWRDNGGTASIRYFNGHLIVTAPRSVHEAISATR
jgi:hypothetical protein